MARSGKNRIFKTDKLIRLGIWGLGRGMSFYRACDALNFDVVAGCDYNEHMRRHFLEAKPGALVTADQEEFLSADFDAVLLATYCPSHAEHAVKCMEAGKHVLSEVTAFHTMAQGVKLVETVERTGLVYNMAENYPFSKANMYLADRWWKGLFGDFLYGEYEYVHELRTLCYTYIDGVPVQPGWTAHNWRSWINYHYYNTHSLGPIMYITRTRPVRVVALPAGVKLEGYLPRRPMDCLGTIAPSLISMSNGGLVRNLMGSTPNDTHCQRLWGTRGASESTGQGLFLRLGGSGHSAKLQVEPDWPEMGELANGMGHGGGDFWVMYYFARQILLGKPAFFDVYTSADCTIPGLLAYRSAVENGRAYDVPDFREKSQRNKWRRDEFAQEAYDVEGSVFPTRADRGLVGKFTTVMKDLIAWAFVCRATLDWMVVCDEVKEPAKVVEVAEQFLAGRDAMQETFAHARRIARAYPESDGARVIGELFELAGIKEVTGSGFVEKVRKLRTRMKLRARKQA